VVYAGKRSDGLRSFNIERFPQSGRNAVALGCADLPVIRVSAAFGRRHLRIRTLGRCCCERRAALCLLPTGAQGQRRSFELVNRRGVVLVKFDFRFSVFDFRKRAGAYRLMPSCVERGAVVPRPGSLKTPRDIHRPPPPLAGCLHGHRPYEPPAPLRLAGGRRGYRIAKIFNANEYPYLAVCQLNISTGACLMFHNRHYANCPARAACAQKWASGAGF
jgi:hypothetical protein